MQAYEKLNRGKHHRIISIVNSLSFLEINKARTKKININKSVNEFIIAIGLIFFVEGLFLAIFRQELKAY